MPLKLSSQPRALTPKDLFSAFWSPCNVFTISCICETRVVVIIIMPPSFVSVTWNAESGETLLGPASTICSACNACCHCRIYPTLIDPRVSTWCGALWPLLVTLLRTCSYSAEILLFMMPTWSHFQFPSSYTVSVSLLVINAEFCMLNIDSIHRGVCFLLYEGFNKKFLLLTVTRHVLVFELYPVNSRHCLDQFCLLRLLCILTWQIASASMLFHETFVRLLILHSWVPPFLLRCFKC